VCGYPTSDTLREEGRRAIRTEFSRNSHTSVFSNRDQMSPPPSTAAYTELSSTTTSSDRYSTAPRQMLELPSHRTCTHPTVPTPNVLARPKDPSPSASHHRENPRTPKIKNHRTRTRTHANVTRHATSCNDRSNFMRHGVRRRASEVTRVGMGDRVLGWIRRGESKWILSAAGSPHLSPTAFPSSTQDRSGSTS
jgi:hypothetical protein